MSIMKSHPRILKRICAIAMLLPLLAASQPAEVYNVYSSGSTGADGEFNPTLNPDGTVTGAPPGTIWRRVGSTTTTNLTVPLGASGIFHFTRVTVPAWAYVRFIPNANNTPVVWLSKSNIVLNGIVSVSAPDTQAAIGATATLHIPGPGGYYGGGPRTSGQGPRGGVAGTTAPGGFPSGGGDGFISLPLVGGSGGCGSTGTGGGGGGVIYLASSTSIAGGGWVDVEGGSPSVSNAGGGGGRGVAAIIANQVSGCRVISGNVYSDSLGLIVAFQGGSAGIKTIFPPAPVGILSGPTPVARIASIGTYTISDAAANATVPFVARIPAGGLQTVTLETRNLPSGITFQVMFSKGSVTTTNTFAPTVGTTALATSSGTFDFGGGTTLVSAVATQPVQVALAPAFRSERLRELQIACDSQGQVSRQYVTEAGAVMSFDAAMRLALMQGKWAFLLRGGS